MLAVSFLKLCLETVSNRRVVFVVMNALYFCFIFVVAFLSYYFYFLPPYEGGPVDVPDFLVGVDWSVMVVGIFLINLTLSGFLFVTLPGLVFFPLSAAVLLFRGFLWGVLLSQLPTAYFLAALPTVVLEGEGYVLASVAGITLGLSWIKPNKLYRGEVLSRFGALRKALIECGRLYVIIGIVLFVAAVVEIITIAYL